MSDVLGSYMKKTDATLAETKAQLANNNAEMAETKAAIADKNTSFVTYLIQDNKSNKEIIDIVKDVTEDFINDIRKSLSTN